MIKVGIKTEGKPVLRESEGFTIVENMLIGDGFHWQKTIEAKLPGKLISYEPDNDEKITLVNILPIETYLECVVGSEMNPEAPIEFLKAHAVISRSWALGKVMGCHNSGTEGQLFTDSTIIGWDDTGVHRGFDVCSDDHCQRYQGIQPIPSKTLKALKETEGEVIISPSGKLVDARFSKCCGGKTEIFKTCWQNEEPECLSSVNDPWCNLYEIKPKNRREILSSVLKDYDLITREYGYRWQTEISKKEIRQNLKQHFKQDIGDIKVIQPIHRGSSGRINLLLLRGEYRDLTIGKELWIRRLLSKTHLYSSQFKIENLKNSIKLTGQGWGHGVGLCQIGAAHMALKGYDYKEILQFYYPDSGLRILPPSR